MINLRNLISGNQESNDAFAEFVSIVILGVIAHARVHTHRFPSLGLNNASLSALQTSMALTGHK